MCGIVGIAGNQKVGERLLDGLRRLEYRGYDSAGIATIEGGAIAIQRAEGKLANLQKLVEAKQPAGFTGIGHTRWATHGKPTEANAHPHSTERVALVHNGIIENFQELRHELEAAGAVFRSQTDTEVIVHLVDAHLRAGAKPADAVMKALTRLQGAFALGILFAQHDGLLIAARKGSPLAIGYGRGEMYLGSDAIALSPYTTRIAYLDDGDVAVLTPESAEIFDAAGKKAERTIKISSVSGDSIGKDGFRHFMLKEIHEQPKVIGETMQLYCDLGTGQIRLPKLPFELGGAKAVSMVACGTSYYAAQVARYWMEELAGIPVYTDIASEFRYRPCNLAKDTLALFISQSGETADTLAAMRAAKAAGLRCVAIVNVAESTMAHEADGVLLTHAGPEIGVASTKAFTSQLLTLACFSIALGTARGTLTQEASAKLQHALAEVPSRMVELLHHEERFSQLAQQIMHARDVLYIGRGSAHAIALEGALKLKEISYIHAEGYAAGELKHGPIALIDEHVPVVAVAPGSDALLFEKTASNIQEAAARGAQIVLLSDARGCAALKDLAAHRIEMPAIDAFCAPILYAVPVQLLAYFVAVHKGTDVDQPRNLAKSVTVE